MQKKKLAFLCVFHAIFWGMCSMSLWFSHHIAERNATFIFCLLNVIGAVLFIPTAPVPTKGDQNNP